MNEYREVIDRMKEALPLSELMTAVSALTFRRNGKYLRSDQHSGLVVDDDRGWYEWYSRGTTPGSRGDHLDWLQHHGGLPEWRDALRWMSERTGVRVDWSEEETARYRAAAARGTILDRIVDWMHERLLRSERGMAYCTGRGWSEETITAARLGLWPGSAERDDLRGHLELHGVALDDPLVVAVLGFRGDVAAWLARHPEIDRVPEEWLKRDYVAGIYDEAMLFYPHVERSRTVYLSARRLKPKDPKDKSYNLRSMFVGSRRPYWNHVYSRRDRYVVVVEGQADAITLAQWGVPAVALVGTNASDELIAAVRRHERVFVALDADGAGSRAARDVARALGPSTSIVTWPDGGDANDWLQAGADALACERLLGEAVPLALWLARQWRDVPPLDRDAARREAIEAVGQLAPYEIALHGQAIAKALGVRPSELTKLARSLLDAPAVTQSAESTPQAAADIASDRLTEMLAKLTQEQVKLLASAQADHEGHAKCVHTLFGERLAWVKEWGWLAYNGKHWDLQHGEKEAEQCVVDTLRMRSYVAQQRQIESLYVPSKANEPTIRKVLSLVERYVARTPAQFDDVPDLLNVANGVVDLRTGHLMPHDPKHLFLYCVPTQYKFDADYSDWLLFLASVIWRRNQIGAFEDDRELMEWLQMAVGYSITGHTRENVLFYIYGPTRSGKGTFSQTLQQMLGTPLSASINFSVLTAQDDKDSQNFALARLQPCRIVVGSEPGKYERFNEAKVKTLTGEDSITCAYKHRNPFEYRPRFKIWLSANWPFNADPNDNAAWARARIITFPNSYEGQEDKHLKSNMGSQANLEGVLRWAVLGAVRWYELGYEGLSTPATMILTANEQRSQQDYLQQFLDECAETSAPARIDVWTPSGDMYKRYESWAKDGGMTPMKHRTFSLALKDKSFKDGKEYQKGVQVRVYYGISLRQQVEVMQLKMMN